jgi:outer membrane protein OmpA-like peptidoglycan-associated protein
MKKQSRQLLRLFPLGGVILIGTMSGGCGAKLPDPITLQRVRASYREAAQDRTIVQYAPTALRDAKQVLDRAEQAWQSDQDTAEVEHLSYLTEQRVAIARARADNKAAELELQQLSQEREKLLREAHIQEAAQARQEADDARAKHEEAEKKIAMLQEQLRTLQAKATSRGAVITLGSVLFAPGQATLRSELLHHLYALVTLMREEPERRAIIEGYTDNVGSDEQNIALSQRRAEAVRDFLIQNGIRMDRVEARGYGEESPVASNDTEAGRQQNRRVEIVFPK